MSRKIIVTGGSGFIGGHIISALLNNGDQVFALGRSRPNFPEINFIEYDLVKPANGKLNHLENIEAVIHCSSVMADSSNLQSFSLLYDNLKMCESIVEIVKETKAKQLINLSSIAVYPNIDGKYSEESLTKVSDNNDAIYGLSKLCAENLFDFLLQKIKGIAVTNLRIAQVFGPGMRSDRTYDIMRNELQKNNTVTVFSNGERVSNFVSVFDVVEVVQFFLNQPKHHGIFNVGGENLSYKELAQTIIDELGNEDSEIILVDKGVKSEFYLITDRLKNLMSHG